ncbi:CaiB/BaiF CoA-transferase family protein [Lacisediminimonas sp.]|uniref:CaiB/BaiF CoA transferase family protein n=1 Tax=Lacisediminimonas sp. TaxID=3060582 RepID=UPI0027197B45|nr:CaiB/BaiF CoA-transferase family protein [Lacisediminimonas sp.]MDO8300022.1 CaiB/BaiF CoA-transferase family protein [Lacisediminimonas sp.]
MTQKTGPLKGIRIVELAGIGPSPMAAMMLADLGATVLRIDRTEPVKLGVERPLKYNLMLRNRQTIAADLKTTAGRDLVLQLVEKADGLIEGFRPGVTERLGLGPDDCLARNPRLVYGRMTGWGQDGPLSHAAGHDLNYIAVTGVLDAIGRDGQPPTPPLNLVGDYGGGGMYLALGMVAAMLEARSSGKGQVVDAAICDGAASLGTSLFGMHAAGLLAPRGQNILDAGTPWYEVYQCADDKWISIAPIEGKFYSDLVQRLGLGPAELGDQNERADWPRARQAFAAKFRTRPRDAWCALLEGTDACFAPVMTPAEAPMHPHLVARKTFIDVEGVMQPAPAPRFSRTVCGVPVGPREISEEGTREALEDWLGEG